MKVWATERALLSEVADVPRNWLDEFAANQPGDVRKFAARKSGRLMYRVQAVLDAVEQRLYFRDENGRVVAR